MGDGAVGFGGVQLGPHGRGFGEEGVDALNAFELGIIIILEVPDAVAAVASEED